MGHSRCFPPATPETEYSISVTVDAVGAERVGIRLSPGAGIWDAHEDNVPKLYGALLAELDRLGPAYAHLEVTTDEETMVSLRRTWTGTMMLNPSSWTQRDGDPYGPVPTNRESADYWLAFGADLISFGRAFIANPDLVERLRLGLPLADADPATFYGGGAVGYLDHPRYRFAS